MTRLISDDILGIVTVFQEAEGEPFEGKVAVAEVIQRRTKRGFMSNGTVAGTVLRRLQFSGWNDNSTNRIRSVLIDNDDPTVSDCVKAWWSARAGSNLAPECCHYYNPSLCDPAWAKGAKVVAEIGNHRFIIPKGGLTWAHAFSTGSR